MERPLEGRVALVTGGGVRLGRALAVGLAHSGATVAVHYNASAEGAKQAAAQIEADGNRTAIFQADLTQKGAPASLVEQVEKSLGILRLPTTLFVDRTGRVRFVESGFFNSTKDSARARAKQLLAEKTPVASVP